MHFIKKRGNFLLLSVMAVAGFLALLWARNSSAMVQPEVASAPSGYKGHWELIFNEDFKGNKLDANKWTTCYWWDDNGCTNAGNNEMEWYLPGNILTADDALHLTAKKETVRGSDGKTYPYTSGMVTTGRNVDETNIPARFDFQYGYVEVRAKVPAGKGLWPAIWLLPSDHVSKPEIDVMEVLGHDMNTVHMNFHYTRPDGSAARNAGKWTGEDLAGEWHIFAVDWRSDSITWYLDGKEHRRFTEKELIPFEPMYLIINLAVGGDWPGAPDADTPFPSTFMIDYVRVWKQAGDLSLRPIADTYSDARTPGENFGQEKILVVDGDPQRVAYLKFDLSPLAGKKIASAWLRIRTTGERDSGSANSQAVYFIDNNWEEKTLTQLKPLPQGAYIIGLTSKIEPNTTYDIQLIPEEVQKNAGQVISLAVVSGGFDGIYIYSREFRPFYPQLMVTLAEDSPAVPSPTATQPLEAP